MTGLYHETVLTDVSADETTFELPRSVCERSFFMVVYVKAGAGVNAGVVKVEESDTEGYSGTWAEIGSVTTNAASKTWSIRIEGPSRNRRIRIETAIGGGTVSVSVDAYKN